MDYTEGDLAPERLLHHVMNLQRQIDTLYEIISRLEAKLQTAEETKEEVAA